MISILIDINSEYCVWILNLESLFSCHLDQKCKVGDLVNNLANLNRTESTFSCSELCSKRFILVLEDCTLFLI
jgi:hypothetical protein